jgi:uncharacterized membrane protein YjjB (DUF3815 family)
VIVPGLLQLAPGFLGTQATFKMLTIGGTTGDASFFGVIVLAAQLGIGILVAGCLLRRRRRDSPVQMHGAAAGTTAH